MANVDFGYIITQDAATVPNSADLLDSGIVMLDATGALTLGAAKLASGVYLVLPDSTVTADTVAAACYAYAQSRGYGKGGGAAGGSPVLAANGTADQATSVLVPGTWTPT